MIGRLYLPKICSFSNLNNASSSFDLERGISYGVSQDLSGYVSFAVVYIFVDIQIIQ
jgi:hypothetical protein